MKINIQKTAKVETYGKPDTAKCCWVVLHGYGQLVDYFIRKFSVLDEQNHYIIAPEGFHRFYLNGTSGRVGASWMTKEERLDDIADNIAYLNQVYSELIADHSFEHLIVLGFSQGASTAARWIQMGDINPTVFVQWAGVFPPDLELNSSSNRFKQMKNFVLVGDTDPYFNLDNESDLFSQQTALGIEQTSIRFNGAHAIYDEPLLELANRIIEGE